MTRAELVEAVADALAEELARELPPPRVERVSADGLTVTFRCTVRPVGPVTYEDESE